MWKNEIVAYRANINKNHFDGGYYASPLPGSGNCADMIFANCVLNTRGQNGRFVALDRATGDTLYSVPLKCYAWSSPVGFLNERGEMFVFTADCAGNVYIIDGKTGEITYTARVGNNFESSPVVVGSSVVVGSRGDTIFKMTLK
ncbi:MAG: PQQ-like beta-propeller repeat protein [Duncaniella sp.]|nr:PQQ-like beta-propeller repeat protein [Duncaniella sp.]